MIAPDARERQKIRMRIAGGNFAGRAPAIEDDIETGRDMAIGAPEDEIDMSATRYLGPDRAAIDRAPPNVSEDTTPDPDESSLVAELIKRIAPKSEREFGEEEDEYGINYPMEDGPQLPRPRPDRAAIADADDPQFDDWDAPTGGPKSFDMDPEFDDFAIPGDGGAAVDTTTPRSRPSPSGGRKNMPFVSDQDIIDARDMQRDLGNASSRMVLGGGGSIYRENLDPRTGDVDSDRAWLRPMRMANKTILDDMGADEVIDANFDVSNSGGLIGAISGLFGGDR
jgi:hypothetical protein